MESSWALRISTSSEERCAGARPPLHSHLTLELRIVLHRTRHEPRIIEISNFATGGRHSQRGADRQARRRRDGTAENRRRALEARMTSRRGRRCGCSRRCHVGVDCATLEIGRVQRRLIGRRCGRAARAASAGSLTRHLTGAIGHRRSLIITRLQLPPLHVVESSAREAV